MSKTIGNTLSEPSLDDFVPALHNGVINVLRDLHITQKGKSLSIFIPEVDQVAIK